MILILCKLFGYTKKLIFKILTDLIYITGLPFWSMKYFTQQDPIHHKIFKPFVTLYLGLQVNHGFRVTYSESR